ncbi:sigma-54 interaction domain-containing protein [Sporomusa termitida]|uniref:Anaerobic nitric oxide reductase transcription regulator NorR n=1 Tax=Sporomusa termitida TaxID=2377 RepID=A0A517DWJ3_9FIRM|nr:sigma 54-interacting transcriptional regulator [Sporomusa termitida]QDR81717.1 Anaerobic nitric oxide reductase transcription regulator NorR [Sporomusa termitida]
MFKLGNIQDSVQQTVAAIAAAIGVEVAIIDSDSKLIASSRGYIDAKVNNLEIYKPHKPFIEAVMKEKVIVCKSPGHFLYCKGCRLEGQCPETAEVLCAIEMDEKIIGVISMVALDEEQRYRLLGKIDTLLEFIHEMAQMLVSKIREKEFIDGMKQVNGLIETTLDSINDGIITFDDKGIITHANGVACRLLKIDNARLIGSHIDEIIVGKSILAFIRAGNTLLNQEYIFPGTVAIHCLISIKAIYNEQAISGAVLTLSDIHNIRTVVNEMTGMQGNATFEAIIGESELIIDVKQQALKMAQSDSNILIQGESGTGKEVFARAIHSASGRGKGSFVGINCAAIPEMLLESELYGYEQGAFTGARKGGKPGKFELAEGGTLFLDEIGDMPLHLQVKLLRVLQERCLERVGGTTTIHLNIRIIAATNQDLEAKVRAGEFRRDLFYRLNVIPIFIPPLRERKQDVTVLSKYFLLHYNQKLKKDIIGFLPGALEVMGSYSWPGNVRELENAVEYAVNIETDRYIKPASLPKRLFQQSNPKRTLRDKVRQFELGQIREALNNYGWGISGKTKAALELGISVPSLYRKLMAMDKGSFPGSEIDKRVRPYK